MKLIIATALVTASAFAYASCPTWKPYGCHPVGTKMQCGCGQ